MKDLGIGGFKDLGIGVNNVSNTLCPPCLRGEPILFLIGSCLSARGLADFKDLKLLDASGCLQLYFISYFTAD